MQALPPRNNTSFPKLLYEVLKKIPKSKDDPLQYHQRLVLEYLMKYPHVRGVLAYQQMGSGKTILAASVCEEVIEKHPDYKILFVASKSLHNNFVEQGIKKYKRLKAAKAGLPEPTEEQLDAHIEEHYELISSNASNMLTQVYRTKKPEEGDVFAEMADEGTSRLQKKIKADLEKIGSLGNLNKTFVVIEEAHNFFNAVTNGSQNAVGLYEMIMNAEEIKLLMLSGSPIVNDPFEFAIAANMLAGYLKGPGVPKHTTLFGEDYEDFVRYFVQHSEALDLDDTSGEPTTGENPKIRMPSIQNKEKFSNRIVGLVSYYGTDQGDIQKLFPTQLDPIVRRVPMSTPQYAMYAAARDKEQEESKRGVFRGSKKPLQKSQGSSVSSYRVRSRQISNFCYPKYASKTFRDEKGHIHHEIYMDKLKPESFEYHATKKSAKAAKKDKAESDEDEMAYGIETWSPKFVQMMIDISQHLPKGMLDQFRTMANTEELKKRKHIVTGPGIVYSQFLASGIAVFGKVLEHFGFKEIKSAADVVKGHKGGSYAIISGDVPTELRAELIRLYNSPENRHGEVISLLLITATGAEGIDTKGTTHVHVMEPYWHWARLTQVFARAVRLNSHAHLPEKDRFVQPYIYLADYPLVFEDKEQQKVKALEDTTEVHLFHKAVQNQVLLDSFLRAIQEASIDCQIHYGNMSGQNKSREIKCKVCSPTDEPLFLPELDKDIRAPSNCRPIQEKTIKVEKILYKSESGEEKEFSFMRDKDDVVHIFEFDPRLNGHKEIFEDHPDYLTLLEKIEKKKKKK